MNYTKVACILIALILIIRCIAFFSGSETAFLSISKIKMKRLVQEKRRNAKIAAELKNNIDELLTIVLIGTNFMNSLASALATALAVQVVGNSGVGVATLLITFFATTFGQIVPKTTAGIYTDDIVCRHSLSLLILEKIFFPIVKLFSALSKGASNFAYRFWKTNNELVTEEELKSLIDLGAKEGTLEDSERKMLYKIFEFSDLNVHDIMKHRSLIKAVPIQATKKQVVEMFINSGLSTIPVYEKTKESIVGIIHYKSVLLGSAETSKHSEKTSSFEEGYAARVMKGVLFVPETFSALELLYRFRKERTDFAVALNEQGCTAGIVTMDDIMRVVFGRMTDEDIEHIPAESRIKFISSNEFVVPGDMKLSDLNSILKLNLESEDAVTLGGWLLEKLGELPSTEEVFVWNKILFVIEDQASRRIQSVKIKLNSSKTNC